MADITKCEGTNCKLKKTCYRYKAKASELQAYFGAPPIKNDNCEYYWKINK